MNYYYWILLAAGILILLGGLLAGYRRGLVRQINTLLSALGVFLCFRLVTDLGGEYARHNLPGIAVSLGLLLFVIIVFSLCHLAVTGLNLVSRLPVIRLVDNLLGAAGGVVIAFFLLYIAQYLLECYAGV